MSDSGYRIGIACEDEAHFAIATFLADGVLLDAAREPTTSYIDATSIHYFRHYTGVSEDQRYYVLKDARDDARHLDRLPMIGGRPIKLTGHIRGKPQGPGAQMWRRLFALFLAQEPPPAALIVVTDTDGDPWKNEGLAQALELMRTELEDPFPVIAAMPDPESEAWFVAGFIPADDTERRRLEEVTRTLSFDPTKEAHRLTSKPKGSERDAKRVLRKLKFDEDGSDPPSREELPDLCERTLGDLGLLEERGVNCGLAAFLEHLRSDLVPVILPQSSTTPTQRSRSRS